MADWALALDVGTSSARAIVFDRDGRAVPDLRHQESYAPDSSEPGQSTFDADRLISRVEACIDGVLARAGENVGRIAAVGVTTFWHSMVGIDAAGRAVTPLYTWADTRSAGAAERLKDWIEARGYHARTGCAIHPSYFPARLAWLRQTGPDLYAAAARWVSPGEYLFLRLFGGTACSVSMASGTGLFNQSARDWDDETLATLQLSRENLSPLTDIDAPARGLAREYARKWPALAHLPWVPAIGDGAASNVGSGCLTDRQIAINLGTSGAIRVCFEADQVDIPEDLWCYRLDSRRIVMGGAFSDGGDLAVWMRETLKLPDWQGALAAAEQMPPDSHGLTILPFLAGERSTGWRPDARATIHGLSSDTRPEQILRAGMEAVALRFRLVYDRLRASFPRADQITAAGGALKQAPFWAQILADALGTPVGLSEESEATSRGAAAVALRIAGIVKEERDLPQPPSRILEPDAAHTAVYQNALVRQQGLYSALLRL